MFVSSSKYEIKILTLGEALVHESHLPTRQVQGQLGKDGLQRWDRYEAVRNTRLEKMFRDKIVYLHLYNH